MELIRAFYISITVLPTTVPYSYQNAIDFIVSDAFFAYIVAPVVRALNLNSLQYLLLDTCTANNFERVR